MLIDEQASGLCAREEWSAKISDLENPIYFFNRNSIDTIG